MAIILSVSILSYLGEKYDINLLSGIDDAKNAISGEKITGTDYDMQVHFIDVGQGDSALIVSDGNVILIDAGENDKGKTVVDYIKKLGITKIDMLISTHPHSDHMGGLDTVINTFEIGKIVMPKLQDSIVPTTKTYTGFLTAVAEKGLKITPAKPGEEYTFGKGLLKILGPVGEFESLNDSSVLAKFTYDNNSFLFTGDMEKTAEKATLLEKNIDLKADVLKVAHHGSSTSTTKEFLKAVSPQYCIIPVGDDNSYNHPSSKTLDTIKPTSAKIYRTDYQGSIVFSITDGELSIDYEKREKN